MKALVYGVTPEPFEVADGAHLLAIANQGDSGAVKVVLDPR
ncbi:hypothetical protein [Mycobacterium sp.]|nr:hypothetical protein [Mycobacterium sp.]